MDILNILLMGIYACGATVFFALALRAPRRTLLTSAVLGLIGQAVFMMLEHDMKSNFAVFTATFVICLLSEIFARIFKAPATVVSFPAMIPLVPGVMLYNTMLEFSTGDYRAGTNSIINVLVYAGCMAMAITLAATISKNILMPLFMKHHEKKLMQSKGSEK